MRLHRCCQVLQARADVQARRARCPTRPTSVFVITGDDIRRSGATSLPEALRLAPNLQVARVSATGYAISARGFNSTLGQQAAGADRRPLGLHAAVLRRLLGRAGRDARGRRAHRGHQRPGRHAVGRQRGQRRHQRHHARGARRRRARWPRPAPATAKRELALRHGGRARRRRRTTASTRKHVDRRHTETATARRRRRVAHDRRSAFAPTGARRPTASACTGDAYRGRAASRCPAPSRSPASRWRSARSPSRAPTCSAAGSAARRRRQRVGAGLLRPHRAHRAADLRRDAGHRRPAVPARARARSAAHTLVWGAQLPPRARPRRQQRLRRLPAGAPGPDLGQPVRAGRDRAARRRCG